MDAQDERMKSPPDPSELSLPIAGLRCAGCATRLQKNLESSQGVQQAEVNFASETAHVFFSPGHTDALRLIETIDQAGFSVPTQSATFLLEGITCPSCARLIEQALSHEAGIQSAHVNAASEQAFVAYLPGITTTQDIIRAIEGAGYGAQPALTNAQLREAQKLEQKAAQTREMAWLLVALALTAPLLLPMLMMPAGIDVALPGVAQLLCAGAVQLFFGARFYRGALSAARQQSANMDTLVAVGTTAAFGLSVYHLMRGGPLYFESSAAVITFVRVGKWWESAAKRSSVSALWGLIDLRPETARLVKGTATFEVPVDSVGLGARLSIRAGERIPVDGLVVDGSTEVDESMLTGESLPRFRSEGDTVLAGSLSVSGHIEVEATGVGESSTLAKMISLVQRAQGSKAPIEKLVDRVAAVFVPTVLVLATTTLISWGLFAQDFSQAIICAVSVLVIACPCALGLATPAALTVGIGAAAKAGIVVQDPGILQVAQKIKTIIFDKTGTLTEGKPVVVAVVADDENELLKSAASLQVGSNHPLAFALRSEAKARNLPLLDAVEVKVHPGRGVSATLPAGPLLVGSLRYAKETTHSLPRRDWQEWAEQREAEGQTVIWVFDEATTLGAIAVADRLRETAQAAIERLHEDGIATLLLSGDNQRAASAVASQLGIDQVRAEVLPEQKLTAISHLQQESGPVVMVGDGINDAAALAAADVGIAMGTGADIAKQSAAVILMRPDPRLVRSALAICQLTAAKIRQNLFWAFAYNVVMIPLAALGYLSPVLAGAAMALSSLSVVANALTLRNFRPLS